MPDIWIKEHCTDCGHSWKFKAFSAYSGEDAGSDVPDQACPKCHNIQKDIGLDVSAGKAPGIGGLPIVRATDMAMEMAAAEHRLTDLSTDGRAGAIMAPKLPARLQEHADAMFDPKARAKNMSAGGRALLGRASSMAAQLRAGQVPTTQQGRPAAPPVNAIETIHKAQYRPNIQILNATSDGRIQK